MKPAKEAPRNTSPRRLIPILGGLAVAAGTGLAIYGLSGTPPEPAADTAAPSLATEDGTSSESQPETIGSAWQLLLPRNEQAPSGDRHEISTNEPQEDAPFTAEGVYTALKEVRLDDNGDVVLDDRALQALNQSLQYGDLKITDLELSALQALIREGLPGKAGEQTAQVVADYYRYLQAETTFNTFSGPGGESTVAADTAAQQYQALRRMRAQYLGPEVAEQLFHVADAQAEYMFEAHRIQADPSLSDEEKLQRANELERRLRHASINVDDWPRRYQQFQDEKQAILNAALSEQDKRAQIRSLAAQHFSPEELEQVAHLGLEEL